MATDFAGHYHDEVITTYIDGKPYQYRMVHCCPGDWTAVQTTIDSLEGWSVRRCGSCVVALSPLSRLPVGLLRTGDRPTSSNRVVPSPAGSHDGET